MKSGPVPSAEVELRNITHSTQEPARMHAIRNARARQTRMLSRAVQLMESGSFPLDRQAPSLADAGLVSCDRKQADHSIA